MATHEGLRETLGRLCQETVLPQAKMFQLDSFDVDQQRREIQAIESGQCGREVGSRSWLISGSKAEGFIIENLWGQPLSDEDNMGIYGGGWCVNRPQYPRLRLSTQGTKPAYCRLKVEGDPESLAIVMGKSTDCFHEEMGKDPPRRCFRRHSGSYWLSSEDVVQHIRVGGGVSDVSFHGPAQSYGNDSLDFIPAVVCNGPLECMEAYSSRKRNGLWPRRQTLERILSMPAVLAPTGHKMSSKRALEWRCSWSIPELLLADDMPRWVKQAYWTLKFTVKNRLKELRERQGMTETEGRSIVGSYHLKTTLMWQLELMDGRYWSAECPFTLFLAMLRTFKANLLENNHNGIKTLCMPHYFIPECNLLEYVSQNDLILTKKVVDEILGNPLKAILMSPIFPVFVYGRKNPRNQAAYTSYDLTPEQEDKEAEGVAQHLLDCMLALESATRGTFSSFKAAKENLEKRLQSLDRHRQFNGKTREPLARLGDWVRDYHRISDIPASRVRDKQDPFVLIHHMGATVMSREYVDEGDGEEREEEAEEEEKQEEKTTKRKRKMEEREEKEEKDVFAKVLDWTASWFR